VRGIPTGGKRYRRNKGWGPQRKGRGAEGKLKGVLEIQLHWAAPDDDILGEQQRELNKRVGKTSKFFERGGRRKRILERPGSKGATLQKLGSRGEVRGCQTEKAPEQKLIPSGGFGKARPGYHTSGVWEEGPSVSSQTRGEEERHRTAAKREQN